ncbi:MAG: type IV pili methyl-accepting chemotaxis transducer N-terminal domain-containing protein, partial [Halopseudomonas sp.]
MTTDVPAQTKRFRLNGSQLRLRYIIALTLIAVLTISSQIIIQLSFESQGYDSRVVNIAGRQRMLSQKIAKASSVINNAENPDQLNAAREELNAAVTLWDRSHHGLQHGDVALGLPGDNSAEVKALFANIAETKQQISTASATLLDPSADPRSVALAQVQIRENELNFLTGMNLVVFRYELEANEKVDFIRRLELILLGITLLVLVLEALLIFAPAARRITADMKALLQREEDLEKLFSVSPTAMLLVNPETLSIIRVNQKAHDTLLLEFSAGETCFKEFMDINHPPNLQFLSRLEEASSVNEY